MDNASDARTGRIAAVERELAALGSASTGPTNTGLANPAPANPTRDAGRPRARPGPSIVYSLRLEREDVATLARRAALLGISPTALARNLIRSGLSAGGSDALARIAEQLETSAADLRMIVS